MFSNAGDPELFVPSNAGKEKMNLEEKNFYKCLCFLLVLKMALIIVLGSTPITEQNIDDIIQNYNFLLLEKARHYRKFQEEL